jgi:hypothetical protein
MARPRLPQDKAEVSGAIGKNAGRFADRKKPARTRPIGEPFARMTEVQRECWEAFKDELPWLNSSHRALLQIACLFRARVEQDPDVGVQALSAYSAVLSKLAATPVDETKISHGGEEEEDPSDAFFSKRPN